MNKPPSIRNIDSSILDGADDYEAYVYEYIHVVLGHRYIGSKKGLFDGTYWHSSENAEFLSIFGGLEPVLDLKIINYGFYKDMQNLESKLQSEVNAKSNPDYYNQSVAPTGNKPLIQIEVCKNIVAHIHHLIDEGKYKLEDKKKIYALDRLQVRVEDDIEHIQRIKERAEESGIEFTKPVIIWEEMSPVNVGEDLIGDGGHTLGGVNQIDNIPKVKTIRLPKSFTDEYDLTIWDLRYIGNLLNPRSEFIKKERTDGDALKLLMGLKEQGQDINLKRTKIGRDLLQGLGFKGKKVGRLIEKAENDYSNSIFKKSGQVIAKYNPSTHPKNWKRLQDRADSLRNDRTIVITFCTAYYSKIVAEIIHEINKKGNENKYRIIVLYFHNKQPNKDQWDQKWHQKLKDQIKNKGGLFDKMMPVKWNDGKNILEFGRELITSEMDYTIPDIDNG